MKKIALFFLLGFSMSARSQEKEAFYVFDANWKPAKIESAHFFLHTHQLNDTCWQWDFYNFAGPLIKTEQYRDKDGSEPDGLSYHYNEKGFIDSMTTFTKGKKNGESWKLSGDSLKYKVRYLYRDDSLVEIIQPDSLKKDSSIRYKDERESQFPGGIKAWYHYLAKNLKYPDRAVNGNIQGQVIVRFVVDKAGNVVSPLIAGSVEYSVDEEALRIIRNSGTWEPAFQNGHFVKSYKQQPLNFKLQ